MVIHQSLHGYSEGHKLLQSSISLTPEQRWQMLVMSDPDAPRTADPNVGAVIGYPLTGGGHYCLAKTWQAPELPRPGCVWTHSLIIADPDLAHIPDLRHLSKLFSKPEFKVMDGAYSSVISLSDAQSIGTSWKMTPDIELLFASYEFINVNPIEVSEDVEQITIAVLGMMNQQWPKMRRNFSFFVGLHPRPDMAFDLMIHVNRSLSQRATPDNKAIRNVALPTWISFAIDDLLRNDHKSDFRKFLWTYGFELDEGRSGFVGLTLLFIALESKNTDTNQILIILNQYFSTPKAAAKLKSAIFSLDTIYRIDNGDEIQILRSLIALPEGKCIPDSVVDIQNRVNYCIDKGWTGLLVFAVNALHQDSPRASQLTQAIAELSESRILRQDRLPIDDLIELTSKTPALVHSESIWRMPPIDQMKLLNALKYLAPTDLRLPDLLRIFLNTGAWEIIDEILRIFQVPAIEAFFTSLDQCIFNQSAIPLLTMSNIAIHAESIAKLARSGKLGSESSFLVTLILEPHALLVRSLPVNVWLPCAFSHSWRHNPDDQLKSEVFLLSIALREIRSCPSQYLSYSFGHIYEVIMHSHLSDGQWAYLEPYVPLVPAIWDRCERLLKGTLRVCISRDFSLEEFVRIFDSDRILTRALEMLIRMKTGRVYLSSLGISRDYDKHDIERMLEYIRGKASNIIS